ncbi:MAG: flagellar basal body rod protein FlgC [Deltaproteobacteria bacterium]|nr:flagellar basal body rod protein FlgC [Deltaproteobacteria bacterium]
MDFFSAMDILASGLGAERVRMNVTASNLANAQTTRTAEGGPYKRRDPVFTAAEIASRPSFATELDDALRGVAVTDVVADPTPPRLVHDPSHPDADPEGNVSLPNINMVEEMVNMITASRAYEAGVTAMRAVVDMAQHTLSLGK